MTTTPPRITIFAGPNGAGKTTFARAFLPAEAERAIFVNADLIAAGLSPFDPSRVARQAGRLMLAEIHAHARRRESFAFETTLAGLTYAPLIRKWRSAGYVVTLMFLSLPDVRIAIERVRARVSQGGHDVPVPVPVIRQRFERGLRNFSLLYRPLVNEWSFYDNSGTKPVMLSTGSNP